MKSKKNPRRGDQFTVRNVPLAVQKAMRRKAVEEKKSLNQVLIEALTAQSIGESKKVYHDLDHLAGTWEEDPAFDEAIALQDRVDEGLWR
jgi:hypothetical protein